jgi:hypothetical protein
MSVPFCYRMRDAMCTFYYGESQLCLMFTEFLKNSNFYCTLYKYNFFVQKGLLQELGNSFKKFEF